MHVLKIIIRHRIYINVNDGRIYINVNDGRIYINVVVNDGRIYINVVVSIIILFYLHLHYNI